MVDRLTKAKPTIGESPLDSLIAQRICWSPEVVDAAVLGLPVWGRRVVGLLVLVLGRDVALASNKREG